MDKAAMMKKKPSEKEKKVTAEKETVEKEAVSKDSSTQDQKVLAELKKENEELQKKAEENYGRFVRSQAELENQRKRFDREKKDLLNYGLEKVITDLLPAFDSFDKALNQETPVDKGSSDEGFQLVYKQLRDTLGKHGLSPVEAEGQEFDPVVHQAIQQIPSEDVHVMTVKDVFVKGYLLNGRLIRASMVSVLTPQEKPKEEKGS